RIGLTLAGWDVAVVDGEGVPVDTGEVGELVIGGVGLARYTDPFLDAERFAPMPTLGWTRAYRSGDLVRLEPDGLYLVDRTDDRVEVNGRRVDLGAVDAALSRLSGVSGGAAAVRPGAAGAPVLVGYLAGPHPDFDLTEAHAELAQKLPAALPPSRLVLLDQLPPGRRHARTGRHRGLAGRGVAGGARRARARPGCRFLRTRRRVAVGRAARGFAAAALSAGHRR